MVQAAGRRVDAGSRWTESEVRRANALICSRAMVFEGWQFKNVDGKSPKAHEVMEYPKLNLAREVPEDIFFTDPENNDLNEHDLVRGVPVQREAEAWRRLLIRFEARTVGKEMLLARRVVIPPKIMNRRETAVHVAKWQECGRKAEQEYGSQDRIRTAEGHTHRDAVGGFDGGSSGPLGCQPKCLTTRSASFSTTWKHAKTSTTWLRYTKNTAYQDQCLDHQVRGALGNVEVCMLKRPRQGPKAGTREVSKANATIAGCPKRLTCWTCGELGHRSVFALCSLFFALCSLFFLCFLFVSLFLSFSLSLFLSSLFLSFSCVTVACCVPHTVARTNGVALVIPLTHSRWHKLCYENVPSHIRILHGRKAAA